MLLTMMLVYSFRKHLNSVLTLLSSEQSLERYALSSFPNEFLKRRYHCCFACRFNNINRNPMKGVRYLQEQGLLGSSPTEIAQFLLNDDRPDKV